MIARESRRGWWLYAGAWIPAVLLYAGAVRAQGQATMVQALITGVVVMGIAALEGVGVWWITRRIPVGRGVLFFSIHALLAGVYGVILVAAQTGWLWLVAGGAVARYVFGIAGHWQLVTGAYMYTMIAGIAYFIRTQRRLREEQVNSARAETAAAQQQLRALRAQLNPHFLFNSLHSLSTLVRHDAAAAEDAIDRLGELLRYALDHGALDSVRLRDELDFVRNYVALERLRFADRLAITFDVDDAADDAVVPPFVLQPLVENAIGHGLAPRARGGEIRVTARIDEGRLALEVSDNGCGADPDAVARDAGLGLGVLRRQLEARYGRRATFAVDTATGAGFRVRMTLPAGARAREPVA